MEGADFGKARLIDIVRSNPTKAVQKMINEAESGMASSMTRWRRYRTKYRMGLQYLRGSLSTAPNFPANYIYGYVETAKSHIPKLPKMVVKFLDTEDKIGEDLLSELLSASVENAQLDRVLKQSALHHGAITGIGWLKVDVQPDAFLSSQPDNAIQGYPPESILVDPSAVPFYTADNRVSARYIIERRRDVSLEEAEYIAGKTLEIDDDFKPTIAEENYMGMSSFRESREKSSLGRVGDLLEVWINTFKKKKPWYRLIMWGDMIIRELAPSPFYHPFPPHVPLLIDYDDGAEDFSQSGAGIIEEIEPLHDKAGVMDMQIMKNIKLIVNRQRVVNKALGLNPLDVDNTENRVYGVMGNPKEAMHWDAPTMLSSDVYIYRTMGEHLMEVVSGFTGTQMGRKPTGIQAAKAIGMLTQQSDIRLAPRREAVAYMLARVGEMCLSNIFQFWETARTVRALDGTVIRVVGEYPENLKRPDDFDDLPEELQAEVLANQDQFKVDNKIDLVLEDVKKHFSVYVPHDSAFPEDKTEASQMSTELFRLGGVDRRALLEGLDYPGREAILARMGEKDTGRMAAEGELSGLLRLMQIAHQIQQFQAAQQQQQVAQQQAQIQQAQMQQGGGMMPGTAGAPMNPGAIVG